MLDLTDTLLVLAVVIPAVALLGHLWVAYRYAPDRAKEGTIEFFSDTEGQALFGQVLMGWLKSEDGAKVLGSLIDATASAARAKIEGLLTGAAGNAVKAAQTKGAELLGAIDFGNPVLNGMWAMTPPEMKRQAARILYRATQGGMAKELSGVVESPDEHTDTSGWR